jgi:hypothetical protein
MMKKLVLAAAAASLFAGASAYAKEAPKSAAKPVKGWGCDGTARAALELLIKAQANLKASKSSGKAASHFSRAQVGMAQVIAEVEKGCAATTASATSKSAGDAGKHDTWDVPN